MCPPSCCATHFLSRICAIQSSRVSRLSKRPGSANHSGGQEGGHEEVRSSLAPRDGLAWKVCLVGGLMASSAMEAGIAYQVLIACV